MPPTAAPRAVVVGVDGSPSAALAVSWAAEAARARDATLRLVAAYRDRPVTHARAQAEEQLDAAAAQARRLFPDLVVETMDVSGSPTTALLSESEDALALVVGSRRLGPVHRIFTTSVGRTLAVRAPCPVVVVRESASRSIADTRVVVGVAGPGSTDELHLAFAEASRFGTGLTAVHVLPLGLRDPAASSAVPGDGEPLDGHRMLMAALRPLRAEYPDVDVRRYVVDGSVADRLVTMSENARLLVLGSGEAAAWSTLGPVSRDVLLRSHCPVAVVRTALKSDAVTRRPTQPPADADKKVLT
jgi:nucleotide-binding universal stress UspA family protein